MKRYPIRFAITIFCLLFASSLVVGLVIAQVLPRLIVSTEDSLSGDNNSNGLADEGDVIDYTVVIANCGGETAGDVRYQAELSHTELVANSLSRSSLQTAANCAPASNPNSNPAPTSKPNTSTPSPIDPAPTVQTSNPANGDSEIAVDSNIDIQFSEAVNGAGDWFEIACTISGTFKLSFANVVVTGGPINFSLDPNVNLQSGETCTITVFASQVTDSDTNDPLNNMAANYVFSFSMETPPSISTTNPTNGGTGVLKGSDIVISFDEAVTANASSFNLECPAGTPFAGGFAVSGSGTNIMTINPTGNLPTGTSCQVVVIATNVSDVDANDPPDTLDGNGDDVEGDDYTFSFTIEADTAPSVQSISPANGAVAVPTNTTIQIVFDEAVDIMNAAAFSIECPVGTPIGFTVTSPATLPASTTTIIITPAGFLPTATTCTLTVFDSQVADSDSDDPPNNMAANVVVSFDTAP